MRRAERHELGRVADDDVALAIQRPILDGGRTIEDDTLQECVTGTGGYPFLIQLVGYRTWQQHPKETAITGADARVGIEQARRRLGSLVHAPEIKAGSDIDKTFLFAMGGGRGAYWMRRSAPFPSAVMPVPGPFQVPHVSPGDVIKR